MDLHPRTCKYLYINTMNLLLHWMIPVQCFAYVKKRYSESRHGKPPLGKWSTSTPSLEATRIWIAQLLTYINVHIMRHTQCHSHLNPKFDVYEMGYTMVYPYEWDDWKGPLVMVSFITAELRYLRCMIVLHSFQLVSMYFYEMKH
jgi:hypothetical protein